MNSDQFFGFKMNLVFWILFFCFSHFTLTIGMNVPCDGNGHRGIWTCLKDNDSNTVNVTYDCKLNNEEVKKCSRSKCCCFVKQFLTKCFLLSGYKYMVVVCKFPQQYRHFNYSKLS